MSGIINKVKAAVSGDKSTADSGTCFLSCNHLRSRG